MLIRKGSGWLWVSFDSLVLRGSKHGLWIKWTKFKVLPYVSIYSLYMSLHTHELQHASVCNIRKLMKLNWGRKQIAQKNTEHSECSMSGLHLHHGVVNRVMETTLWGNYREPVKKWRIGISPLRKTKASFAEKACSSSRKKWAELQRETCPLGCSLGESQNHQTIPTPLKSISCSKMSLGFCLRCPECVKHWHPSEHFLRVQDQRPSSLGFLLSCPPSWDCRKHDSFYFNLQSPTVTRIHWLMMHPEKEASWVQKWKKTQLYLELWIAEERDSSQLWEKNVMNLIFSGYLKIGFRQPMVVQEECWCRKVHTGECINACINGQPTFSQAAGKMTFTLITEDMPQMSLKNLTLPWSKNIL